MVFLSAQSHGYKTTLIGFLYRLPFLSQQHVWWDIAWYYNYISFYSKLNQFDYFDDTTKQYKNANKYNKHDRSQSKRIGISKF